LYWASLPPLELWPLAWLAPIPWLVLVRRPALPGRRPYGQLWLCGAAFWLAAVYWLVLPHWSAAFGWLALAAYLGLYLPAFVGLARGAVHGLGLPLAVAAPCIWVGLELARAHLLSGFLMAALGHTQYRWIGLIQVSDLAGGYAVSFLVMWVAAWAARMLPADDRPAALWPLAPLVLLPAAALGYGAARNAGHLPRPGPTVALVQGSIDSQIKHDPAQARHIFDHYAHWTDRALAAGQPDLIVWPETMFPWTWFTLAPGGQAPPNLTSSPELLIQTSRRGVQEALSPWRLPLLVGISTAHMTPQGVRRFNSALLVDAQGQPQDRYDKMHLVAFGEYVPLARFVPALYRLTPLPLGLDAGQEPIALPAAGVLLAPNICYESTVPHLLRRQVRTLAARGQPPDVLVNLTNDGWFHGSSELDMHLVCGVFRAVELRRPLLIAANTGFSAWIESDGRIAGRGPRREPGYVLARPGLDGRTSLYERWGDVGAGVCLWGGLVAGLAGQWRLRRRAVHEPRPNA
jgi:apolipoprotein N-acyltransferase